MSFIDWVHQTRNQFATKTPREAFEFSSQRFVDGLLNRFWLGVIRVIGQDHLQTTVAGERVKFICRTIPDVRRTRSLTGEKRIAEWLFRDSDGETVFWDVGGFHGNYSVVAASKGCDVFAFEPLTYNRQRLKVNRWLNGYPVFDRVTIIPYALSDTQGESTMVDDGPRSEVGGPGQPIELFRGDDVESPNPNIVKIDTEGHELSVLRGMEETLRTVDRIVIEVHGETGVTDVERILESAGLSVGEIDVVRPQTFVTGVRD